MSTDAKYMAEQINAKLAGGQIRNAVATEDGESFGFDVVVKAEGRGNYNVLRVWVDCDAEGNGPGWLNIEDGE